MIARNRGLIRVGAAVVEFRRRELKHLLVNVSYLALLAFMAWERFGPHAFTG